MSTRAIIYLQKDISDDCKPGTMFVNVHYLEGYNQGEIKDYQRMARAMKKDIPEVSVSEVNCGHVIKSSSCYGFTLTRWNGVIKFTKARRKELEKAGWHIVESGHCEYNWA